MIPSWERLRTRLAGSRFRSRFKLGDADRAYVARAGWETLRSQAETIVRERLAPATAAVRAVEAFRVVLARATSL